MLFAGLRSVRIVKTCDLGHFQDLGHSFSPYGPPSRQITYIYSGGKWRIFVYIWPKIRTSNEKLVINNTTTQITTTDALITRVVF